MNTVDICGVGFSNLTMSEFLFVLKQDIENKEKLTLSLCNPEFLVEASNNQKLMGYLQNTK